MITQIASILSVAALTYLFLSILGPRPRMVFLSLEERAKWLGMLATKMGSFMYVMNIAATLTSLATVYLFFIGTSSLFGFAIYTSVVSILLGTFITPKVTAALLKTPRFSSRIEGRGLTSVAITSLFWADDPATKQLTNVIRGITLASVVCILWLEFASLTKLAGAVFGSNSLISLCGIMFLSVFFVVDFTLRNGLRGFLFTDLLDAPLILLGAVILCVGIYELSPIHTVAGYSKALLAFPKLPIIDVITFCLATTFLNSALFVTSEAHWLRVWAMRDHVAGSTMRSGIITGLIWLMLIGVGLIGATIITDATGVEAVIELVRRLANESNWYAVAFWTAATAAIFSTCDGQLYSALVLISFDNKRGQVDEAANLVKHSIICALGAAIIATAVFYVVEVSVFPFDRIVFFIFPIFLCLTPAFVQLLKQQQVTTGPLYVSGALYALCGLAMIIAPSQYGIIFSLAAPLMPLVVSALVFGRVLR